MSLSTDVKEINFALYLDELYGEDVTQGVTQGATTREERKARARALIVREHAEDRPVGNRQTMREAFEAVYGEPLVPIPYVHEHGDCA